MIQEIEAALTKSAAELRDHPLGDYHAKLMADVARAESVNTDASRIPVLVRDIEDETKATAEILDESYRNTAAGMRLASFALRLRRNKHEPRPDGTTLTKTAEAHYAVVRAVWGDDSREAEFLREELNGATIDRMTSDKAYLSDSRIIDRAELRERHRPITFRGGVNSLGYSNWHNSFKKIVKDTNW
jgi:hypothetical protein